MAHAHSAQWSDYAIAAEVRWGGLAALIRNCLDCYLFRRGTTCTEGSIMARPRLPIVPHLSPEEVARRYRTCRGGVEKTPWQILWLLTRSEAPPPPAEVAARLGLTP